MKVIAVDDEPLMLYALNKALSASKDVESIVCFSCAADSLAWIEEHPVDMVFCDISMRGMDGMEMARQILKLQPECRIVFCTGYEEYALAALWMHASGYLLKPVTEADVQREIDYAMSMMGKKRKSVMIRCFGTFEVFVDDHPISFRRSRTKELLALLVDHQGAGMKSREIIPVLWPQESDETKAHNYLRQLFLDLRKGFEEAGVEDVVRQNSYQYTLNLQIICCDYFEYLKTGTPDYKGEYMNQYAWAQEKRNQLEILRKNG